MLGITYALSCLGVDIEQTLHPPAADDMVIYNIIGIIRCHIGIERVVRDYLDYRAFLAEAETSGGDDIHPVGYALFSQSFLEPFADELA